MLLICKGGLQGFGAVDAIQGRRDNTSGVTGAFSTGVEAGDGDVLEGFRITVKAHRGRGAGLHTQKEGVVGIISVHLAVHLRESAPQAQGNMLRKKFMEGGRKGARMI
jgi:hypothetical protein